MISKCAVIAALGVAALLGSTPALAEARTCSPATFDGVSVSHIRVQGVSCLLAKRIALSAASGSSAYPCRFDVVGEGVYLVGHCRKPGVYRLRFRA